MFEVFVSLESLRMISFFIRADVMCDKDLTYLSRKLFNNYSKYLTLTSADIVSLSLNKTLSKYPAWALVLPWEPQTIEDKFHKYIDTFVENRSANGFSVNSIDLNSDINSLLYSYLGASTQVYQTHKLYRSFKKYGILNTTELPIVDILVDDSKWRWMMSCSGNHRAYILFHMGYDSFQSRIGRVINKKNAKSWPNVINGLYTIYEAEYIFDMAFEGLVPIRGIV